MPNVTTSVLMAALVRARNSLATFQVAQVLCALAQPAKKTTAVL
jgi:hypothetical protein